MGAASMLAKIISADFESGGPSYPDHGVESWAADYAEPGYHAPEGGVLFADWNPLEFGKLSEGTHGRRVGFVPSRASRIADLIDRTGADFAVEWSDEWATCGDCGRAVRTSPDSHGWRPSFVIFNDCELVCRECIADDVDALETHLANNPNAADTFGTDWAARGWFQCAPPFESGMHPGQNDDPAAIAAPIERVGKCDFLFTIDGVGQFDTTFSLWVRPVGRTGDDD